MRLISLLSCFLLNFCASQKPEKLDNPFRALSLEGAVEKKTQNTSKLQLIYSSNLQAELGTCGCAYNPVGGVDRRWNFIQSLEGEKIQLDSGNALFSSMKVVSADEKKAKLVAQDLAEAQVKLGVEAQNIGRYDLALGINFLKELQKKTGIPLISSNLVSESSEYIFPSHKRLTTKSGKSLFVMGFSSIRPEDLGQQKGWKVLSPIETLEKFLPELLPGETLIVLSDLSSTENRELAQVIKGLAIFVGSTGFDSFQIPVHERSSLLLQPLPQGQETGVLEIFFSDEKRTSTSWLNLGAIERFDGRWDQLKTERSFLEKQESSEIVKMELERNQRSFAELYKYVPQNFSKAVGYRASLAEMNAKWSKPKNVFSKLAKKYK